MNISRRTFLKTSATGGAVFTLGFVMPHKQAQAAISNSDLAINAYIRITEDNQITLLVDKPEMGQGTFTSLPMVLAEELDADWQQLQIEHVKLPNKDFPWVGAAGSSSVKGSFMALRQAGARARAMLVQAAAKHWRVNVNQLRTENSHVINTVNGERLPYGKLITSAAQQTAPKKPTLKTAGQFQLLGKDVKRTESPQKVTGRAQFGIDAQLPNMHYATIARPPVFGARLKSVDDAAAKKMPGVIKVKTVPSGIAVIADSFWHAKKARDALVINWNLGDWQHQSTGQLLKEYRQQSNKDAPRPTKRGDPAAARYRAAKVLEMTYELPFLAHAPMEPLNCTVHDHDDSAEVWTSCQFPTAGLQATAKILGHSADNVTLHNGFLGGGFGRRGATDFIEDAAHVAKGEAWPVKLVWTREEDVQGGYYRPMVTHRTQLSLNDDGKITAFENTTVGQGSGIHGLSYHIPNQQLGSHRQKSPVRTHFWRSVDNSHTAFAIESGIDEAAAAAQQNPFNYRRELLQKQPRMLALLDKVEHMSGWGQQLPKGTGLGVAIHPSFGSIVAQVAQVTVRNSAIKVDNVWCAVDCGFAVNPLNVKAQMESAIIYGLSAALFGEITFDKGKVVQSNFHNYPVVRMEHSPNIDVAIINSGAELGGIGEPGLPPIAPAVANAIFAATGKRLRALPFKLEG